MARTTPHELGGTLRTRRRALGLTQGEVADLGGVSAKFLIDLERGKESVRLDKVLNVLDVLGLELRVGLRE